LGPWRNVTLWGSGPANRSVGRRPPRRPLAAALRNQKADHGDNLYQDGTRQLNVSSVELDAVRQQTIDRAHAGDRNLATYGALVGNWGKLMQRLSITASLGQPDVTRRDVPLLTQKTVTGSWNLSAVARVFPVLGKAIVSGEFIDQLSGCVTQPEERRHATALCQAGVPLTSGTATQLGQRTRAAWHGVSAAYGPRCWRRPGHSGYTRGHGSPPPARPGPTASL
jgi:hypothetical protein